MANERDILVRLDAQVSSMRRDLTDIKASLREDYVHQGEFRPVRMVVYGLVSAILMSVIVAILALVLK
jgi:thiosulfate reductase cytochrome b subunit